MENARKDSGKRKERQWEKQGKAVGKERKGSGTHTERQWETKGKAVENARKGSGTHMKRQWEKRGKAVGSLAAGQVFGHRERLGRDGDLEPPDLPGDLPKPAALKEITRRTQRDDTTRSCPAHTSSLVATCCVSLAGAATAAAAVWSAPMNQPCRWMSWVVILRPGSTVSIARIRSCASQQPEVLRAV